ncbi:MAG TPA: magnesium transporter [Candidatus Omnitrophota bacterium]|jgi:magnesium transporter|nr:magnesium transporter [Candidatus Omnitrophota bacterium]HPN55873.1 magnesium transporter [Candidatus Omnitrophota bacterium]
MPHKQSLISPEIKEILNLPNKAENIKEAFSDFHSRDIFVLCESLEPQENAEIVMALGRPLGIEFFQEFKIKQQREIFKRFSKEWMGHLLDEMAPDERADFIKALPRERADELLPLVAQAERNDIKKLVQYEEGTAGSILTTEYAFIPQDIKVKEAIERLKLQAFNKETIYYVYVTDKDRQLLGFVSLKDLLVAGVDRVVKEIMHTNIISSLVTDDKEVVAQKLSDYDLLAIPVVDNANRLMGIVTVDDVLDVIVDESTEDIYKYGAAGEYVDYMGSHPGVIAKQRILWLLVLVVMGFFSGMIMEKYAFQLEAVVALAFFIPLLCDSGGNAGTQSSTVVIRGLATGEIKMKDVFRILRKELLAGLVVGLAMGGLAGIRAIIMNKDPLLGVTVGLSMIVTVVVATTLGAMLPLLFKKMKLDPALMSGPFITSIVDIVSLFVYLNIAVLVLK